MRNIYAINKQINEASKKVQFWQTERARLVEEKRKALEELEE